MQMENTVTIPNSIQEILLRLEQHGYQAYLVGGCVRDMLMGLIPHDWDVCTDALPAVIVQLFPDSLKYGMKHGTVTVRWENEEAEITTFRTESEYSDHRRPDHVTFIRDLHQDLARRDFTVNAIAMDSSGRIHDPFGGQNDIAGRLLRAVGDPEKRFQEDALRMLRAIRFSAQLGFEIDGKTMQGIRSCASLTANLASERVSSEIEKTLLSERPETVSSAVDAGLLEPWGIKDLIHGAFLLQSVPNDRTMRWMGFSLLVKQFESVFEDLHLDHQTIAVCRICNAIRSIAPSDELDWKYTAEQFDISYVSQSAEVLQCMNMLRTCDVLQRVLNRGDCLSIQNLAVDGKDLIAMGLSGKAVGNALQYALHHVFEIPEDNEKTTLLTLLKKEFACHE